MTTEETLFLLLRRLEQDGYDILSAAGPATPLGIPLVTGKNNDTQYVFHVFVAVGTSDCLSKPVSALVEWPINDIDSLIHTAVKAITSPFPERMPVYFFKVLPDTPAVQKHVGLFRRAYPESTHVVRLIGRDGTWSDIDAKIDADSLM